MIGKQEADRIIEAIAIKLSDSAAAILASANHRGAIRYVLTWDLSQELRELVDYKREYRGGLGGYRITELGRAVSAKRIELGTIKIRGGDRVYLPDDDRRTYGTVLSVSDGEANVRWGATPGWPIHKDCHRLEDLIKIGGS